MVQLGREVGEEKGERGEMRDERERGNNKGGQFRNIKCYISKNGIPNSN